MTAAVALSGFAAVPVADIHPSPNNPREKLAGIDELGVSIRENGLIQPLIVQRHPNLDGFQLVAGHRRHEAIRRLGWATVPCIIRRDLRPDEELLAMLVENGQRAGLDPIEEARALRKLKAQGLSDLDIAHKVGRSQTHVSSRLSMLALSVEEQEELRAGQMSVTEATSKGRLASGRVRPGAAGKKGPNHLGAHHGLAARAKARCLRLKHGRGKGAGVGGIACGECWESVIRADERQHLHDVSEQRGTCVLCDTTRQPAEPEDMGGAR